MKRLKHRLMYQNRFGYKLWHDFLLKENGEKTTYDYLERRGDYVVIIPKDKEGNFYFVKHYRYAIKKTILELPVGYIDQGESPVMAAKRELYEEIGAKTIKLKYLGYVWQIPGIFKLKCHIFYANNISTDGKSTDTSENLKVVKIKQNKLKKLIADKKIEDSSSLVALARFLI